METSCHILVNDSKVRLDLPVAAGRIGLLADSGTILSVETFELSGSVEESWLDVLPTDGLMQAGQDIYCWDYEEDREAYRFGFGYRTSNRPSRFSWDGVHRIKWIFRGSAFRLWMPARAYGKIRIELDGSTLDEMELLPDGGNSFRLICERNGLAEQNHALSDSFSYMLPSDNSARNIK